MEYLVKLYCPEEKIVLDPFCGSGSTGIAALKNNRKFIGIEKESNYCEISKKRIELFFAE
jgi:DNA modification methylase